jgi:hypothetical protein
MCSLFLQPDLTLLFNAYTGTGPPWTGYALAPAAFSLARLAPFAMREGNRASVSAWHALFEPFNRAGLVFINTHGGPTEFHLPGGPGQTGDVPLSIPAAVLMTHSYSAADPSDPRTIAGRWLANGAFVYFGSMHEPYLQSFQPPALVAGLLAGGVPLAAAVRRNPPDPFGRPWRLVYLGDPLYQVKMPEARLPRLPDWDRIATWPEARQPGPIDLRRSDAERLEWVHRAALHRLAGSTEANPAFDLAAVLLGIGRDRLESHLRPAYDALLIDTLLHADRPVLLFERLAAISAAGSFSQVERTREWLGLAILQNLISAPDYPRALAFWSKLVRTSPVPSVLQTATERVAGLADTPARRREWRQQLVEARRELDGRSPLAPIVGAALNRVERQLTGPS